jgi:hypothetical protein
MEHQPADLPLPIEAILTCDEGQDSTLHDVELSLEQQGELASSSLLRVQVARRGGEERWEIARRYEDCVWLFKVGRGLDRPSKIASQAPSCPSSPHRQSRSTSRPEYNPDYAGKGAKC